MNMTNLQTYSENMLKIKSVICIKSCIKFYPIVLILRIVACGLFSFAHDQESLDLSESLKGLKIFHLSGNKFSFFCFQGSLQQLDSFSLVFFCPVSSIPCI